MLVLERCLDSNVLILTRMRGIAELSEHDTLFLTVNVRPAARVIDTKLHSAPILSRLKPTHARLTERAGNVTHVTEVDGVAAVCLRWETLDAPVRRVGLRVVHDRSVRGAILASAERALDVDHHLTHMEAEFNRLGMGMQRVLSEADYAKERDSLFHRHTQALDEATLFWPVVQVSILLMTGFAQATHIVRFFKSRRII